MHPWPYIYAYAHAHICMGMYMFSYIRIRTRTRIYYVHICIICAYSMHAEQLRKAIEARGKQIRQCMLQLETTKNSDIHSIRNSPDPSTTETASTNEITHAKSSSMCQSATDTPRPARRRPETACTTKSHIQNRAT